MKTFKNQIMQIIIAVGLISAFNIYTTSAIAQNIGVRVSIAPPQWAPEYENAGLVQYYYLPDIECYYDVWHHEFAYLEDGNWMFGATLPAMYSWYDLNNAFIVVLDQNVHEPWMHFHYYVAHYPRYYYRTIYRDSYADNAHPMRGFNENARSVVYKVNHAPNQVDRRSEMRQEATIRHEYPERKVESTRPSQPMKYYGKEIGQPVKVKKNMKRPKETVERQR